MIIGIMSMAIMIMLIMIMVIMMLVTMVMVIMVKVIMLMVIMMRVIMVTITFRQCIMVTIVMEGGRGRLTRFRSALKCLLLVCLAIITKESSVQQALKRLILSG